MAQAKNIKYVPFLKWAGGKRWLVDNHVELVDIKCKRYIEPFLGSGAVFFKLAPKKAILADKNPELIDTFTAIRDDWQKVGEHLQVHQRHHNKAYYYRIRDQKPRSEAGKAAQFIYLNRTCWNGLYRVNLKGKFNVPKGTKSNVVLDTDSFESIAKLLKGAELVASDFEDVIDKAEYDDFVFVDPPYTVKHNNNAFLKYNEHLFSWADQKRLRDCIAAAYFRGARIVVTNAYHSSIRNLYKGIGRHEKLTRASVISGNSNGRGDFEEIVIRCL